MTNAPGVVVMTDQAFPLDAGYAVVPTMTLRQARLALLDAGVLDQAESIIQGMSRADQVEWDYGDGIRGDSTIIAALKDQLPMTDEQVGQLFLMGQSL
jgi:hypothetical protein